MSSFILSNLGISTENAGFNNHNFKILQNYLSNDSTIGLLAIIIAISGLALYFMGTILPCLACGPVRSMILTFIAFLGNCLLIYTKAKKKCSFKLTEYNVIQLVKLSFIPTIAFLISYTILPWFFPLPLNLISFLGPGKTLIPAIMAGIIMTITMIFTEKYMKGIC